MVELHHVYKTYPQGTHALRNVSFEIERGEFVFLSGPSGAGKTTLFKLLTTSELPSSGQMLLNGLDVNDTNLDAISAYRKKLGVVFQDFKLLKDRTLFENVALPMRVRKERESYVRQKVYDTLDRVGLHDKEMLYPDMLSGGEQQRVALARAVIHQPLLLIADEPTGNLDAKTTDSIFDLIESLSCQGTTVIVATHDQRILTERRKRIISLKNGEVVSA